MSWSITPSNAMRVVLTGNSPDDLDAAYATARKASGWPPTPAEEALMAVEWAANEAGPYDAKGEFVTDFVELDLAELLGGYPEYARWRAERLGA